LAQAWGYWLSLLLVILWFTRNCRMTEAIWIRTLSMKLKIQPWDLEIRMSGREWDLPGGRVATRREASAVKEALGKAGRKAADLKVGSVGKAGQKEKGVALTQ